MELIPFNGRFTIESPRGGHKTFQIKTAKAGKLKDARILSLFVGTENANDNDYQGFAFVNPMKISIWRRFIGSDYELYAKMLTDLNMGEDGNLYKLGYRLLIEKRCRICNKVLTTPESVRSGIGPTCAGRTTRTMSNED